MASKKLEKYNDDQRIDTIDIVKSIDLAAVVSVALEKVFSCQYMWRLICFLIKAFADTRSHY